MYKLTHIILIALLFLFIGVAVAAEEFPYTEALAGKGDIEAMYNLGRMHIDFIGGNWPEGVKWYRKAADQGFALAQEVLGSLYYSGDGVPQDYTEAAKWYGKAADQGRGLAQWELGALYYSGKGVPQDYAQTVKWYRKAADQGIAGAMNNLGNMYLDGLGVPQNFIEAYVWYNLSEAIIGSADFHNWDLAASRLSPTDLGIAQRRSAMLFEEIQQRRRIWEQQDQQQEERYRAAWQKEEEFAIGKLRALSFGGPDCLARCSDQEDKFPAFLSGCDLVCEQGSAKSAANSVEQPVSDSPALKTDRYSILDPGIGWLDYALSLFFFWLLALVPPVITRLG